MTKDLGTIFSLAGAAILNGTYTAGGVHNGGRPRQFRYALSLLTDPASGLTVAKFKVQGSADGTTNSWFDLTSQADDLTVQVDQIYPLVAGTPLTASVRVDGSYQFLRVALQGTGVANALDLFSVSALASS